MDKCTDSEQRLFLHKIQVKQNSADNKTLFCLKTAFPPPLSNRYSCTNVAYADLFTFFLRKTGLYTSIH